MEAPAQPAGPGRVVLKTDEGRLPDLLPLRHGRMVLSPFTFYRGSAFAMAEDLAGTPSTGIHVQCGGDSHLVNFRGLATAERQVIFAINDLDETLPAPWEWDLKRLAASVVVACRDNGLSESVAKDAVLGCVRSYRERMAEFSEMKVLDLWYFALEAEMLISTVKDSAIRQPRDQAPGEGPREQHLRRPLSEARRRFGWGDALQRSTPGDLSLERSHPRGDPLGRHAGLQPVPRNPDAGHRMLLDHYESVDAAIKVVGVGSVGTACFMILLMARGKRTSHSPSQGGARLGPGGLCGKERLREPRSSV